jgi:hypothetical protein
LNGDQKWPYGGAYKKLGIQFHVIRLGRIKFAINPQHLLFIDQQIFFLKFVGRKAWKSFPGNHPKRHGNTSATKGGQQEAIQQRFIRW